MSHPIQVILNPERHFIKERERNGGGGATDFFAERNEQFLEHKKFLINSLADIAEQIESSQFGKIGYIKISLHQKALAKSHRPFTALFKSSLTPYVGNGDLGELYVKVTPKSLSDIATKISRDAEDNVTAQDKFGLPKPSRARSEVGAIHSIELYQAFEKQSFSVEDSISWLSQSDVVGGLTLELFEDVPRDLSENGSNDPEMVKLFHTLFLGIGDFRELISEPLKLDKPPRLIPELYLSLSSNNIDEIYVDGSLSPNERHAKISQEFECFLKFLQSHPLVRKIKLPLKLAKSSQLPFSGGGVNSSFTVPSKNKARSYPRMGIIDGGIASSLNDWVIGQYSNLANSDLEVDHGTFIAGLCCFGQLLNSKAICSEPDGVEIFDVAIHPRQTALRNYYSTGIDGFLDEIEQGIHQATSNHGTRIFNLSINATQQVELSDYSEFAARLDEISDRYSCLIVISAGNLSQGFRQEWNADLSVNLKSLASSHNEMVLLPAESIRNISVSALNPSNLPKPNIPFGFASYSRRGPGTRTGNKPDFAHIGGAGVDFGIDGSGLKSITSTLSTTTDRGTSYAAPLVARTAAQLDHEIADQKRIETIKALLIHNSSLPDALSHRAYQGIGRELAGYGVPASADVILQSDPNEITMMFEAILDKDRSLKFEFPWPVGLSDQGKCRGDVKLTLAAKPPLDTKYGAEFVRINIDAALQQEDGLTPNQETKWTRRIKPYYLGVNAGENQFEKDLINHCFKWSNVKVFKQRLRGVGQSSNWRLHIKYLTRSGYEMPDEGVPLSVILSIADADREQDVFNQMKQQLNTQGIELQDIRVSTQVKVAN